MYSLDVMIMNMPNPFMAFYAWIDGVARNRELLLGAKDRICCANSFCEFLFCFDFLGNLVIDWSRLVPNTFPSYISRMQTCFVFVGFNLIVRPKGQEFVY